MIPHLYSWRGRVDIFSSDNLRGLEGEILRGLEGGILRGLEGRERERWLSLIFSITPAVIYAPSRLFLVMILFNNQIVYYNCPVANSINTIYFTALRDNYRRAFFIIYNLLWVCC